MNTPQPNSSTDTHLIDKIRAMAPWHHDIQLTPTISTGKVFSETGRLSQAKNDGVSLISPRVRFLRQLDRLYPDGLTGLRFLDCACNAGGYCFWARERDAELAVGFDVRQHWIDQAKFVAENRTVEPVDRIEFFQSDLHDLPKRNLEPFDLVYFSGIFYHLPDPITGLKIAADLTRDILILNTAMDASGIKKLGLSFSLEDTEVVMSGVHGLAWFPNNPETVYAILKWMGFEDTVLVRDKVKNESGVRRVEILAARQPGRFDEIRDKAKEK